jgi:hypothetical protein
MVSLARRCTDVKIGKIHLKDFEGKIDCFGKEVFAKDLSMWIADELPKSPYWSSRKREITLGDVMYLSLDTLMDDKRGLGRNLTFEKRVPPKLGEILTNVSTYDLLKYGGYNVPSTNIGSCLIFSPEHKGVIKFIPSVDSLPVRAGVSIEAGMKSRLTTAAPAAFNTIGQLVGHRLRNLFSHDPFIRIGFEEADKLWEVLKAYSKRYATGTAISDL